MLSEIEEEGGKQMKRKLYAHPAEIEGALGSKSKCGELAFLSTKPDPYGLAQPYYIVKVGRLRKPKGENNGRDKRS